MSGTRGHGLRGGSFEAVGDYLAHAPVRLRMRGVRFVSDVAVSGTVVWDRRASRVSARLRVTGATRGRLRLRWNLAATRAVASMNGRLGGRSVRLRTPAP